MPFLMSQGFRTPPGLGCCGGGCECGMNGLGLFDDPLNLGSWGWQEWGIVLVGVYVFASLWGDVGSTRRKIRGKRTKSTKRQEAIEKARRKLKDAESL